MPTGTATLDFGAFPGSADATATVTGQAGLLVTSKVEAWLHPAAASADHSVDEHLLEQMQVAADPSTIVAGTSFAIRGFCTGSGDSRLYGQWSVAWVWV
jgi:hypothetical protein